MNIDITGALFTLKIHTQTEREEGASDVNDH